MRVHSDGILPADRTGFPDAFGKARGSMQKTRTQIQLQYHQTLNRICEMEILAEQLTRLADSYRKEERGKQTLLREKDDLYKTASGGEDPGDTLQLQAKELRSAAEDWYRRAKEEYRSSMQEIRRKEERDKTW